MLCIKGFGKGGMGWEQEELKRGGRLRNGNRIVLTMIGVNVQIVQNKNIV